MSSVIIIFVSGLLFSAIHSLLASQRLKDFIDTKGLTPQQYRLIYVIIAIVLTIVWLAAIHRLPDQPLYILTGYGQWLCYGLQLIGIVTFWLSLQPIDTRAFLGLRQFKDNKEAFIEEGIYRYIRHPMYSGLMLLMFAMPTQTYNSLALYSLISLYFLIGSRLEERRMITTHPEYNDYCNRVPAFIPMPRVN